jgi:signal transduction histidine kinase
MKVFAGFVLMLLIQAQAQAAWLSAVSPADTGISRHKIIDRLNDTAFEIALQSPDSSRKAAERALLLAERIGYKTGIGTSFLNIGHVYWSQSYYHLALLYFNKALNNLPADRPLLIADTYELAGRTYADLDNYRLAFDNLDKAREFAANSAVAQSDIHRERSYVYARLKDYRQAINEANLSLQINPSDKNGAAIVFGRLSGIYRSLKNYKDALAYSDTAYRMSLETANNRLRAKTYVEYASIYNELHEYQKAVTYAAKGAALAEKIGVMDALSSAYRELIAAFSAQHNTAQVIACQQKYISLQDSLGRFYKTKNTELVHDYLALDTRLNAIEAFRRNAAQAERRLKSQRLIIISLSSSLLVIVVVLLITFYYEQKKQLNEQFNKKNEALLRHKKFVRTQTENIQTISKIKEKLLIVIEQELRTPLAELRNITEMFEDDHISTDEAQWLMKDINSVVKSTELTLTNLEDWASNHIKGNFNSRGLDLFLLGVEMHKTFDHALKHKNIEFINEAAAGFSALADENHIKIVLRNLIGNAIKFTGSKGYVKLFSSYKDNMVIVSVQDNGRGMSAKEVEKLFYPQTHFSQPGSPRENSTGIGLILCKELIEINGGRMWIRSKSGKGSTFSFSIPLNTTYA